MAKYKDNRDSVGIQITTFNLNGKNYLLWALYIRVYFSARRKLKFVTSKEASFSDAKFPETVEEEWDSDNYVVMT